MPDSIRLETYFPFWITKAIALHFAFCYRLLVMGCFKVENANIFRVTKRVYVNLKCLVSVTFPAPNIPVYGQAIVDTESRAPITSIH